VAHARQSRPDYGLGLQVQVMKPFQVVPFSRGGGEFGLRVYVSGYREEGVGCGVEGVGRRV